VVSYRQPDRPGRIRVIVITGPVGVGKTSVGAAASAILSGEGVPHAFIDVDALRWCHPSPEDDPFHVALGLRNLAAVWRSYREAGARRLLLADVVEAQAEQIAAYRAALETENVLVVRLVASIPSLHRRLECRETGASLEWHRNRAIELQELMERRAIGDIVIETDERAVTEVAREMLVRAGWIESTARAG
jgi:adenylylsulfate kinase